MILFCDNDIVHKLAACNLLDDALSALGVSTENVRVLPTAKHKFGITKDHAKFKRKYGEVVFGRIRCFLEEVGEVDNPSVEDLLLLDDVADIDRGEATLISATAAHSDYLLATGDKRCLGSLATNQACRPIADRLRGRAVCLEQIIRKAIEHSGFEHVKRRVVPAVCREPSCDIALLAAFGSGLDAAESNVLHTLDAYIRDLQQKTESMLTTPQ